MKQSPNIKPWVLLALNFIFAFPIMAQIIDSTTLLNWERGNLPKEKPNELYQIKVNGFYRFFGTHLHMPTPYILDEGSGSVTKKNTLFIGDDTQLPNLMLNITGRPNKKVSWGFDLFMFQFLDGNIGSTYNPAVPTTDRPNVWNPLAGERLGQNLGLNLGLNLYGSYYTNKGTYTVRMGGIHWLSLSDLTLAGFKGYNRFLLSERNPWDPIGKTVSARYNQMYENGSIYQDSRWGERAVQGVIIDGVDLPNGWSFVGMYGKTELNGGFITIPNSSYGGKLKKLYRKSDFISLNTLNNITWVDSLNTTSLGFNVFTLEWLVHFKDIQLHAEVGTGKYNSPINDYPWGEAISVKLLSPKRITKIPIELHYYRISPYVVNNNAIFWNTAIIESAIVDQPNGGTQSANVLTPFSSSMVALGQMTNNRTGLNVNTAFKLGKVNLSMGYGVSSEIKAFQNRLTFSHLINQLTRSRLWRWEFPNNIGPYGRYDKVYRDAYQKVNVTDDSLGISVNPKKFNQLEMHAKYRTKLANRNFFAFVLGRYYTAQPELSLLPAFNENAYIRQYNSELELYYQISNPIYLNAYLGYERVIGNYQTELDSETLRPLNQTGYGFGGGFDINLSKNAGLFVRHRWVFFEDTSYRLDKFSGQETMIELKVFF